MKFRQLLITVGVGTTLMSGMAACRHEARAGGEPREIETIMAKPRVMTWRDSMRALKFTEPPPALTPICRDEVGRDAAGIGPGARAVGSRLECLTCKRYGMLDSSAAALRHARALWVRLGKAPYASEDEGAACMLQAYDMAIALSDNDRNVRVEKALRLTMSANEAWRSNAFHRIDAIIDSMVRTRDSVAAAAMLADVGLSMLERAERMDARPPELPIDKIEAAVHRLVEDGAPLRQLPPPPKPSKLLGESEAVWAHMIFDRAATLVRGRPALNARYERLSYAPLIVLERWKMLDSLALDAMRVDASDSVAPVVRALARFHLASNAVRDYPAVMALFDSALIRMPHADSTSYDAFDRVLGASDDEWRAGFQEDRRNQLDARAWTIVDPLWLTPVNEVLLTRRARVAEANVRYAGMASAGQSGSETPLGIMLVKRGPPTRRWKARTERVAFVDADGKEQSKNVTTDYILRREWPGLSTEAAIIHAELEPWKVFYSDFLSLLERATRMQQGSGSCLSERLESNLLSCARVSNADYQQVPFYARFDTIDVALTRFRARDSVDLFISARIPLRRFLSINDNLSLPNDSITYGAFVETEQGVVLFHQRSSMPVPNENAIAKYVQWRATVPNTRVMHRVEAVEPRFVTSARGSRRLTSMTESAFALEGFGISDVVIADTIASPRLVRSWRDLTIRGNGAVAAPNQRVSLAWETYDLKAGPDGLARWRVTVQLEDGKLLQATDTRGLIIGDAAAMDRMISIDNTPSTLSYVRTSKPAERIVDFLNLPTALESGRHVLVITVQDLVANMTVRRSVGLRVLDPKAQARRR